MRKKGMDSSQITGATSSYARKYVLNGLFNIDDTKEADSQNQNQPSVIQIQNQSKQNGNNGSSNGNNIKSSVQHQPQIQGINKEQLDWLGEHCQKKNYSDSDKKELMKFYRFSPKTTTASEFIKIQKQIEADAAANISVIPARYTHHCNLRSPEDKT
jgi:hypothetical protein